MTNMCMYMYMVTMIYFLQSFGDGCNDTVNECDILSWTEWMVCTNESGCNTGDIIRKAGICCRLNSSSQQCMDQCNLTDSDVIIKGLVFHCWLFYIYCIICWYHIKHMSRTLDILATISMSCLRLLGHIPALNFERLFAHVFGNLSLLMTTIEHEKLVSVRRRSEIKYNLNFKMILERVRLSICWTLSNWI